MATRDIGARNLQNSGETTYNRRRVVVDSFFSIVHGIIYKKLAKKLSVVVVVKVVAGWGGKCDRFLITGVT